MHFTSFAALLVVAWLGDHAKAQEPKEGPNNPPAIRKALDEKVTIDFKGESFNEALDHLSQKTKIKIVFDYYATVPQGAPFAGGSAFCGGGVGIGGIGGIGGLYGALGAFGIPGGYPMPPVAPGAEKAMPGTVVKIKNTKARTGLQDLLNEMNNAYQTNLTFVIVGDSVVVTTEERGQVRQLRQRINVDIQEQPLGDALKKLANDTGINLLVDPRHLEKAKAKMDLKLDDVTLETALRLMTEFGDLAWVSVGNVVLVTNNERAEKLRKENEAAKAKNASPPPAGGVIYP
jgi:hypothetical protein